MKELNNILSKIGISKVKLAKHLGVSRQMVYNYLELDSIDKWPKEKQILLFQLFNITEYNEDDLLKQAEDKSFALEVNKRLNKSLKSTNDFESFFEITDLNKENKDLIIDITKIIKEILEQETDESFFSIKYLHHLLQSFENVVEIKYILAYMAKANGFIEEDEFSFDKEEQFLFEGILYSALNLYSNGGASKSKVSESRRRFVEELQYKSEEKLSRTQQLFTIKEQALKELGYKDFNDINANEVLEKIVEIESRKV